MSLNINMNSQPAIEARNITKRFNLVSTGSSSLKNAVIDAVLRRRPDKSFTALDDVSLSVAKGETLGIVGANGSGKSTLLSIIARTMTPSSGAVETRGVISSLLELGAGFHPDLTGRENVLLYGSIMGIPRETMKRRFDEIVDFAGLGQFIDQPVRFYSSGMYVRLGFSVAVQVDPDILLVDEVLAVGDQDFQAKCLAKMNDFRAAGKSMILITHDLNTVCSVSDRVAYLRHGKLTAIGQPDEIAGLYNLDTKRGADPALRREWGTRDARITTAELISATAGKLRFKITYAAARRIETPTFGFAISAEDGRAIFGSNTEIDGFDPPYIEGEGSFTLKLDANRLHAGKYLMSFSLHSRDHQINYHRLDNHLAIKLDTPANFDGICRLPSSWNEEAE